MSGLNFDIAWIAGDDTDPYLAHTMAELKLTACGQVLSTVFDKRTNTTMDRIRVPLYPLAQWFACNWWRLHKESRREREDEPPTTDFLLAHNMAAVGYGYVWPKLEFYSDDRRMAVRFDRAGLQPWESIRYDQDPVACWITMQDFAAAVGHFITQVEQRLQQAGLRDTPLQAIWQAVQTELAAPDTKAWRETEARLGYDPDAAPEHLLTELAALPAEVGPAATEEILPVLGCTGQNETAMLSRLRALSAARGIPAEIKLKTELPPPGSTASPWHIGRQLARAVRAQMGAEQGPVTDRKLAAALGTPGQKFNSSRGADNQPIGLGVRNGDAGDTARVSLHFRKQPPTAQRFEAARFIADQLISRPTDQWLPLTDHSTFRQKVQRAFATEFLVPFAELEDYMANDFTPAKVTAAARRFSVAPLVVRHHLHNHGHAVIGQPA